MWHKNKRFTLLGLIAVFLLFISACGGSSGSGGERPPAPAPTVSVPTAEDVANARSAQVRLLFKAESGDLSILWTDTFPSEGGYRVERQLASGGEWQIQESLPAAASTGTPYTWTKIIDQSATYRIVAERGSYVVPLETEAAATEVLVDMALRTLALLVAETDPLNDVAHLSVQGAQSALSVEYFVDLKSIGTSSANPSFSTAWDTRTVPDGNHLLLAHVHERPGLRVELRRSAFVDNPNVAISLDIPATISGVANLSATATSDVGIRSVEFFLNGASTGMGMEASGGSNRWTRPLDTRSLAAGSATIRAVATDNADQQAEASAEVVIDNPPVVALERPFDGTIVSGSLEVRGTLSDDRPGAVVRVSLGDVQILEAQQGSFMTNYSLAGLPGVQYTLTVAVRDSAGHVWTGRRAVVVAPSPTFSYVPVGTFDAGTSLLDTDAGTLLYRSADGTVRMHRQDSNEVVLEGSSEIDPLQFVDVRAAGLWQLRDNRVTTSGRLSSGTAKVFVFDSAGRREDVPYDLSTDRFDTFLRSGLHQSWLIWGNDRIYVRDLASQDPARGPIDGNLFRGHAFVMSAGSEALFFTRETDQQQAAVIVDVFRYSLADQSIVQLSSGDGRHLRPKADASRIAWEKASIFQGTHTPPFELVVAPIDNATASTVLSTQMMSFDLKDGMLAWIERASNALALRVDDNNGTTTVSSTTSTTLYSTANGHVIFSENGKLYAWSRGQGKRLLLETLPAQVIQRDGIVFFAIGLSSVSIYRVAL